jgi:hypothetical protein
VAAGQLAAVVPDPRGWHPLPRTPTRRRYRRLRLRTDKDDQMHDVFLKLAVCLICLGFL